MGFTENKEKKKKIIENSILSIKSLHTDMFIEEEAQGIEKKT